MIAFVRLIYIISDGDYNNCALSSYIKRSTQSGTRELTQKSLDIPYPRLNPKRAKYPT
jgi:hypothetical protein